MNKSSPSGIVRVAYAEDHIAVRKGIISYIHDLGGVEVIIEADNGRELIEKIAGTSQMPDVCILDINMPAMNGFETIDVLRSKWPDMKTLILSTFVEELYVVRMIRAGVNGYLSKACDPLEIKEALISIHEKGNYYSDLFVEKIAVAIQDHKFKIPNFTERELCFLKHCCSDLTYTAIAQLMKSTPKSVEGYRDSLFKKLNVTSRVSLALFAVKAGIVPTETCPVR
jgi:two-component system invasion response regulator UvrY